MLRVQRLFHSVEEKGLGKQKETQKERNEQTYILSTAIRGSLRSVILGEKAENEEKRGNWGEERVMMNPQRGSREHVRLKNPKKVE